MSEFAQQYVIQLSDLLSGVADALYYNGSYTTMVFIQTLLHIRQLAVPQQFAVRRVYVHMLCAVETVRWSSLLDCNNGP